MTGIEQEARAEAYRRFTGDTIVDENTGETVPFDDYGYAETERKGFIAGALWAASRLTETVTEAKAEAWDEAIAAVAAWWQTPEDERGVIVNPYGTHPADRLLEDIEKGDDNDASRA